MSYGEQTSSVSTVSEFQQILDGINKKLDNLTNLLSPFLTSSDTKEEKPPLQTKFLEGLTQIDEKVSYLLNHI